MRRFLLQVFRNLVRSASFWLVLVRNFPLGPALPKGGPDFPECRGPKGFSPPGGGVPLTGAYPGGCHSGATPYGPGRFLAGTATSALSSARGTACVRHLQPSRDTRANVCANQSRAAMLPPEPRDFGAQSEWFIPLSLATSPLALLHPVFDATRVAIPLSRKGSLAVPLFLGRFSEEWGQRLTRSSAVPSVCSLNSFLKHWRTFGWELFRNCIR